MNKMKSYQDITHSEFIDSYCYESRKARDSAWHASCDAREVWKSARAAYDAARAIDKEAHDAREVWKSASDTYEEARATYEESQEAAHATYDAACDILVNPIDKIHRREKPRKRKYNNPWSY